MPKSAAPDNKAPANFEAALAELNTLVDSMEAGALPLEDSLTAYQRGVELLKYCEKTLADAEQRIQVLSTEPVQSGRETLKDFSEE
jgi:exodeoxyribonuclease VII small subunit